ncbi:MAG TPA: acyl-CoA reductase [Albitalea sp.]|uniref:acyl-CoA reductase n=1 Tax=Piscinibacter sp. TaxID=1903157 RepID=UPI002ED0299C
MNTNLIEVRHIVKGRSVTGAEQSYGRFATPRLDLNELVWPRREPGPAFDTPVAEIIDILVALGQWLSADPRGVVAEALEHSVRAGPLPRPLLEFSYANIGKPFDRRSIAFQIERELGGADVLDGWREIADTPSGRPARIRAFPPRLVHIVAGNAPGVSAQTVVRAALTKGVHLLKLPSNDLFTAPALLQGLAAVAPDHPLTRSFSAAYWRGGDAAVEGVLFRPQFFDKIVAWGGEATIRSAIKYLGPGLELVSFDPKTSISLIGHEIFASNDALADAAERAAFDATLMNQQACASSRYQFVEGSVAEVDRFCALLQRRMNVDRPTASAVGAPVPGELREEIEALSLLEPQVRVWGGFNGEGLVIRSEEPVDFHPDGKIVNVVPVASLDDAIVRAGVATQTVGIWPPQRKAALRDRLAAQGVQRLVNLGGSAGIEMGLPHDGFHPLQRFVRWVHDEGTES